ncbi:dynein axonemal intermediate chain 7 isoform X2 [Megalopta genalis]|uniref:dynein axonemal intermediate chain 7 isoform X2 n=1 Tax=Megalopta genalis TaxID=115081 RepID=UPI003FCF9DA3
MARKVRKASPKASPTIEEGKGDGVADGEEPVENIRQKMIKDMQEEIRLEQYNQMQCKQQEEQQLKKYETQLGETRAVLDRHWTAFVEDARNLQEQENVVGQVHDLRRTPGSRLVVRPEHVPLRLDDGEQGREHGHGYGNLQRDHRRRCTSSRKTEIENQKIVCISRFLTVDGQAAEDRPVLRQLFQEARRRIRIDREGATHQTSELDRPRLLPIAAQHRGEHDEGGHEDDQICARVRPDGVLRVGADRSACRHETDHGQGQVHLTLFAVRVLPLHGRSIVFGAHRKAIEVAFDEIKLTVKLPVDLDCHRMAIRGLWLAYDHYSVETESRRVPDLPAELRNSWDKPPDLLEFARTEYREKLRIWEEQAEERRLRLDEKKTILEKIENPPALPSARRGGKRGKKQKRPKSAKNNASEFEQTLDRFLPTDGELLPYLPTPNEVVRQREEENRKEVRKLLFTRCGKNEVNLRKYTVLGGVFRVDLIHQPPQPKDLGEDTSLTTLELPKEPRFAVFSRRYEPPQPAPDSERTPEVIEAEMKALETAMESLLLITVQLPDTVFWFEPPLVAHWIPEKKVWSTRDIHDIKYNEEKQTIAFRSGKLGVHGLAANKFANLPFQSWELKPEVRKNGRNFGGVVLNVTAATIQAEFVEDRVCLNSFAGGSSTPLKQMLGEFLELDTLIERMQRIGCDLFPERDAASYLKGLPMKHPVAEKHLRDCMALLSTGYVFAWSRWNATRSFWEIVVQFKEVHGCVAKERTNLTLLVTPWRTMRVRCTEVSPEFSDLPLEDEDDKFYADLYQLAMNTAGIKTRILIEQISFKLVSTVAQLLERTNVISMSS